MVNEVLINQVVVCGVIIQNYSARSLPLPEAHVFCEHKKTRLQSLQPGLSLGLVDPWFVRDCTSLYCFVLVIPFFSDTDSVALLLKFVCKQIQIDL